MIAPDAHNRGTLKGSDEAEISRDTLIKAIGLLIVAFVVLHGLNRLTVDVQPLRIGEQSLWTWLTSTLFAVGALSTFAFSRLQPRGDRWPWVALAGVMLALSVDEVATIHERIETEGGSDLSFLVLQPLLALAVLGLFVQLMRAPTRDARIWIGLAAVALVLAQVGSTVDEKIELSGVLDGGQAAAEELLEMLVPAFLTSATLPAVWSRLAPVFHTRVRERRPEPARTG